MNDSGAPIAVSPEDDGEGNSIGFLDVALIVAGRLRLLILGPLAIGVAVLLYAFTIRPSYTAKTLMMPPQQQQSAAAMALQSLGPLSGLAGAAAGIRSPVDLYVALLGSVWIRDRMIERFDLKKLYKTETMVDTRLVLETRTRVYVGKKDGLITIEVDDKEPKRAADMANAYIEELKRLTSSLATTEAQQRRMFFEKQLGQTKDRLDVAERELKLSGIDEGAIRAEPRAAAEAYARLRAEVTASEVRLSAMRGYLAETAPSYRSELMQLQAWRNELNKAEREQGASKNGDYLAKYREFAYQQTVFELIARQFEMAKLDEARDGAIIQIVDAAAPPEYKSKPKRARMAILATLFSGFALLLWVFGTEVLRATRRNPDAADKLARLSTTLRQNVRRG